MYTSSRPVVNSVEYDYDDDEDETNAIRDACSTADIFNGREFHTSHPNPICLYLLACKPLYIEAFKPVSGTL